MGTRIGATKTKTGGAAWEGGPVDALLAEILSMTVGDRAKSLVGAFEHALIGMAILGPDATFRAANPAFSRMVGRAAHELIGLRTAEVTHPDDVSTSEEVAAAFIAGQSVAHYTEKRYLRPDGTPVPALRMTTALRDRDGRLVGFFTQAVDMTESKRQQEAVLRSDRRHRALVRHAAEVIVLLDGSGTITYASPASERLMGHPPQVLEGTKGFGWIHPQDRPTIKALFASQRTTAGVSAALQVRIVHADGSWRHTEVIASNLLLDRDLEAMVVNIRDVTERHDAEARLQRRAAQQEAVAALGASALSGVDLAALLHQATQAVSGVLEIEGAAVVRPIADDHLRVVAGCGRPPFTTRYPATHDGRPASLAAAALQAGHPVVLSADTVSQFAHLAVDLDGTPLQSGAAVIISGPRQPYGVLAGYSTRRDAFSSGDVAFLEGVANIIAGAVERQRAQQQLQHRALHDGLTGLPNRDRLVSLLAAALEPRGRRPLAVLFIDIDDFKIVNDSLGHAAGDDVVQAVAKRVAAAVTDDCGVARFGGDEFLLFCPDTDGAGAAQVAERIRHAVSEPVDCCGRAVVITVSIGIALAVGPVSVDDLLAHADTAMYEAKRAGKDRWAIFDDGMRTAVTEWLDMTSSLRRALGTGELVVHYQPIVWTGSGELFGAEALLRWLHPEHGLIGPGRFINFAEESGLIVPIGRRVLEQACRQAVAWRRSGHRSMISVNISPRELAEPQVIDAVAATLADTGVDPAQVTLEVTETAVMSDLTRAKDVIERLRGLGVRVGLDDFGTGHSSLSHLAELPLDFVKIDQSFIARISHDRRASALLGTIGRLCEDLDLLAVAEGIETEDQLRRVRDIGIAYSQGFLFGPAVSAEEFTHPATVLPA